MERETPDTSYQLHITTIRVLKCYQLSSENLCTYIYKSSYLLGIYCVSSPILDFTCISINSLQLCEEDTGYYSHFLV